MSLTKRFGSVRAAVHLHIDGDDYDRGAVEVAAKTADNAATAIANLIQKLVDKGVLTEKEVEDEVLNELFA